MYKIAVIEDDTLLGQALVEMLTSHGYQAFAAESVTKARRLLERQPVDLLLIDRGLADGDGVELCRQRRGQEKLPAIFLTARDEEEDIVEAFDAGADDYLVKPVALAVLLKHIEAVLRRTGGEPNQVFYYQDFSLDYDRKEARIQGQPVALTPKEYGILEVLTQNQKKVVTKRMLLEQVWTVRRGRKRRAFKRGQGRQADTFREYPGSTERYFCIFCSRNSRGRKRGRRGKRRK